MVETRVRWFGCVKRRPVESIVRTLDQVEGNQIARDRERCKNYKRNYQKDLEMNELDKDE